MSNYVFFYNFINEYTMIYVKIVKIIMKRQNMNNSAKIYDFNHLHDAISSLEIDEIISFTYKPGSTSEIGL